MEVLLEPFTCCGFMRNALVAGLLTVVASALIGTWVVLRGMAFLGDALAHGVLPGIAVAFLLGIELTLGAAAGAVVMIAGIDLVGRRSRLSDDTSIGLLFVGMLALGVTIISKRAAFAGDLTTILFGDPLGVTATDLRGAAVAAGITAVLTVLLYRPFVTLTFSRDKAEALGMRPGLAHAAMLVLIALAIISSFQTVGTLLVFAFIVAPPATAALVARRVPAMMLTAIAAGAVGVVAGLLVSWYAATAAAATVALVTVAEFFLVLAVREVYERVVSRRGAVGAPA